MRYPCGVGYMGAVRECWHEGSRSGYISVSVFFCRNTNFVKRVMKSLTVGTTSLYIGRVRKCATDCPRIPYLVLVWVRNARTWHASCIPELVDCLVTSVALHKNLFLIAMFLPLRFLKNYSAGT